MAYQVYRLNDNPTENLPFNLLYVTHSEYEKSWHSTPHSHHFTELFYIVSGVGSFVLPDREIPVKQNDLVVINPNVEHTEKSNENDSLEYIALGIQGIMFSLVPEEDELPIGLFTYQGEQKETLFYLNQLLTEIQKQETDYELVCQNIINVLIIKLKRAKNITVESHDSESLHQTVAQVIHYIKYNFNETITLDTLANVANINKYYLSHCFKQDTGLSPIEYVTKVRIEEAKTLLETTDFTISIISEACGFSSQSLFAQTFRRFENTTPSRYRKSIRATG